MDLLSAEQQSSLLHSVFLCCVGLVDYRSAPFSLLLSHFLELRALLNLLTRSLPPALLGPSFKLTPRARCSATLEVDDNGGSCNKSWDGSDAAVACTELGCGSPLNITYVKGSGLGPNNCSRTQALVTCSGDRRSFFFLGPPHL